VCAACLAVAVPGWLVFGQEPIPPTDVDQSAPRLTPEQLDTLVAPIALYPDPLLSQVLAASTYPLEVVETQQWLQQNSNLKGEDLINAAKQQNWDPSVQALVAFPDVVALLNRDIQWTTDLGNAFLAQQSEVMDAVQRMRVRAQQNGKLNSTPQQTVTTQTQGGQSAVVIEPANPQVVYVPTYNPEYIWGPPVYGYYPPLWYPPYGFAYGPGVYIGSFFPLWAGFGWGGWGLGWGWGCGWFGGGVYVNTVFFSHYGFHNYYHGAYYGGARWANTGSAGWQHDPYHRAGVPYTNQRVASTYNNSRFAAGRYNNGAAFYRGRPSTGGGPGANSFNNGTAPATRAFAPPNRGPSGGFNQGSAQPTGGNSPYTRGFAPSNRTGGEYANQNRTYSGGGYSGSPHSAGQSYRGSNGSGFGSPARGYSAPPSYGGSSHAAPAPRSYGGNSGPAFSGGGFGGGHSFSGGGRSFGGGGGGGFSGHGGGASSGSHGGGGGGHGGGRR
jgi:hypothetical protein